MTYNNANMNTCFVKYFNLLVKEIAVQRSATFNCSKWRPVLSNSSANDLWILRFYLYNIAWFATVICWVNSQYRAYASMNSRWICAAKKIGKQKKYVCLHRLYGSVGSFITNERLTWVVHERRLLVRTRLALALSGVRTNSSHVY